MGWLNPRESSLGTFERSLQLRSIGSAWTCRASADYEMMGRMFESWKAAVTLKAVLASASSERMPAALTVSFLDELLPGSDLVITPQLIGGGRSVQHWSADVEIEGDDRTVARAAVVVAERRSSQAHVEPEMPSVPGPEEDLEPLAPPGAAGSHIASVAVTGNPPFGLFNTKSLSWVREKSGRPVDYLQLAFLSDLKAPRSFYWHKRPHPTSTLTLSVYFLATGAELSLVRDDFILTEAIGTRGTDSLSGEQLRLWSRDGTLLATSEQLCWYR
jgi:acyl-CoA thioesterase